MGLGPGGGAAGRRRGLNLLIGGAEVVEAADQAVLSWIARARTPALTDAAEVLDLATGFATVMALRCVVVVVLALYRRFRHLAVFLGTLVVTDWVVPGCCASSFPGPGAGPGRRGSYAFPSRPVSALAVTLFAMTFVLVPRGRAREWLRAGPRSSGRWPTSWAFG